MKTSLKKQNHAKSITTNIFLILLGAIVAASSFLPRTESKKGIAIAIFLFIALLHIMKEGFKLKKVEHTKRGELESIGVYGKITDHDLRELRVHKAFTDDREFAPREIKKEVDESISKRTSILITGPSMSGKTRLAVESIRTIAPECPFWLPSTDEALGKVIDLGYMPRKSSVIFLDDIDRFLPNPSFTTATIRLWEKSNCIIVATAQSSKLSKLIENSDNHHILGMFRIVKIDSLMSEKETLSLEKTSYKDLISQVKQFGLAPLLGGAKIALAKYQLGEEERSWGWALVRSAIDWQRLGHRTATKEQLFFLTRKNPRGAIGNSDLNEGWEWATKPINHTVSLLREIDTDQWKAIDIISEKSTWEISDNFINSTKLVSLKQNPERKKKINKRLHSRKYIHFLIFGYTAGFIVLQTLFFLPPIMGTGQIHDVEAISTQQYLPSNSNDVSDDAISPTDQPLESPNTTPDTAASATQGGSITPPPSSNTDSTDNPGSADSAVPILPNSKNLTRDDFFNPPDNSTQAPFDVAGEKHKGIGVSPVGYGDDELELRLGNRYSRLTFNAGQADLSETSDTYLRVEIIANNTTVSTTDIPFNEIRSFDVDVSNVNAVEIKLSKVDEKGKINYSSKKVTAVLFDIQLQ